MTSKFYSQILSGVILQDVESLQVDIVFLAHLRQNQEHN